MRITSRQLRQIIKEELLHEMRGKVENDSYFTLKRTVDWALRNMMGMAGNALIGKRERAWNDMVKMIGDKTFVVPPMDLYAPIREKLLSNPKVSAVAMDTEIGYEMEGTLDLTVYNIPGWPSPMTHDDFYKAAQFIKRNPALSSIVAAYEADYGDDSDPEAAAGGGSLMEFLGDAPPDDPGDQPFALTRGMVFMIIDLILHSAPKGQSVFYINDLDMEFMPFAPSHPIPAGMTMGRLLSGGGMRDTGAAKAAERLSMTVRPPAGDDDFNESYRRRRLRGR